MPPKAKANGYKMPDALPKGLVLQDAFKRQFRLGLSIGKGGFGEIYSAQKAESGKEKDYPYVVKIEPHSNGPLFVEMHFYTRNAKQADIDAFKASKKLTNLGMPAYVASGSHEHKGEKYRFLVMEKFDTDIMKLYVANNEKFPDITVYKLALQILDVLEYIHSRGYIHADIKGANILLSSKNANQIYLVDFGLAGKFTKDAEFKPNPKKMHDGTIEYLSRDAHQGVQTRRGDLEILAYNLIQWMGCKLPWQSNLKDPKIVQANKEKYMNDIPAFIKACFGNKSPDAIVEFLKYINTLKFNEAPDYEKLQQIFKSGLKEAGGSEKSPLQFKTTKRKSQSSTPVNNKKSKKKNDDDNENDCNEIVFESVKKNQKATPSRRIINTESDSDDDVKENVRKGTRASPRFKVTEKVMTPRSRRLIKGLEDHEAYLSEQNSGDEVKKVVPKKRTRRVNTVATVDDNGVVHNHEMLRIKNMMQNKGKRVEKTPTRLNKSLDVISDSDDEETYKRITLRRPKKV